MARKNVLFSPFENASLSVRQMILITAGSSLPEVKCFL